jgi:hypothetical protein
VNPLFCQIGGMLYSLRLDEILWDDIVLKAVLKGALFGELIQAG